jgi:hypothetical protein
MYYENILKILNSNDVRTMHKIARMQFLLTPLHQIFLLAAAALR